MTAKAIKMEKSVVIGVDEIPLPSTYGAAEMKFYIRRNTYRGALITFALLLLFLLLSFVVDKVQSAQSVQLVAPITKMSLEDLAPADDAGAEVPPPDIVINTGPAARAGNPVPVPDAMVAPDLQDFATVDVQSKASHEGGTGEDMTGWEKNINWDSKPVEANTIKDKDPEPDAFLPVEKEPGFDMVRLQKLVEYPDMARRAGIEGTVTLNVLVDKSGKITRTLVAQSDNKALDDAARKAVMAYGYATPAIMNDRPVSCWVAVPITFRLK